MKLCELLASQYGELLHMKYWEVDFGQNPLCLISCFKLFPVLGSSEETVDCEWQIGQTWKTK